MVTKIIQFGEGNFLRAFIDWQIQQPNNAKAISAPFEVCIMHPQDSLSDIPQELMS